MPSCRVGVAGHRGYSGAELVRLLSRHPEVEPVLLEHRAHSPETPSFARAQALARAPLDPSRLRSRRVDLVFLATPHEASLQLVPQLVEAGIPTIDLSGAFRLKSPESFRRWYKSEHPSPQLLASAVYGLPEFHREAIRGASLVANPGCYPTAANLAIRPLLDAGIADRSAGIVCDAKSGVSGAGRGASERTSFCEVTENFSAYAVLDHRHVPEVLMHSRLEEHEFSFTAQLLPVDRGILETIYFRATPEWNSASVLGEYRTRYKTECFVRVYDLGSRPDLRSVARTNYCDLSVHVDAASRRGVIISAIDNLVKGAAGQAIQNMNLMLGFPESAGLL